MKKSELKELILECKQELAEEGKNNVGIDRSMLGLVIKGLNKVKEDNGGSNISITGSEKGRIQREKNIQPGTDEWFKHWFSKPHLTGEKSTGK